MATMTSFVTVKAVLESGESYTTPVTGHTHLRTVTYPISGGKTLRVDVYDFTGVVTSGEPFEFLDDVQFEFLDGDDFNFL